MAGPFQLLLCATAPSGVVPLRPLQLRAFSARTSNSHHSPLDSAVFFLPVRYSERGWPSYSKNPLRLPSKKSRIKKPFAASGDVLAAESVVDQVSNVLPAAAAGDSTGSPIVGALLAIAFVGLSVLTAGVIYIAVTDFLQKREREKFEKEEAANKKKGGKKKVKVKARAGPRGFGQKIEDDDNED